MIKRILLTSAIAILGVSTSFAAFTFDKQEQVDTAPIVGLYRYQVPAELQGAYNTAGVQNLTASMANEPNTLSMNVAHVKGNPSESYVVEVYKDTAALETHRKSEHFQNYINEVGSIRDDAGYKAGYVLRERNNKTHWYVIQIYSDESAFNKHVNSPGYRFMMSQIQGSLQNVTTKVLEGDILVNHGGQVFVRP